MMSNLLWLTEAQMRRISPYFPLSRGISRVDDQRVVSGIIFVIRNGLRWRDVPKEYGPHKRIYNRFIGEQGWRTGMIDATHLKAHRTAASLLKKGLSAMAKAVRLFCC